MNNIERIHINRNPVTLFFRNILNNIDRRSFIRHQIRFMKRLSIDTLMADHLSNKVFGI